MPNFDLKSFFLGAIVAIVASSTYLSLTVFQDSIFTRKAHIETVEQGTHKFKEFTGSGTVQIVIQFPQRMTDWDDKYEIYAYRLPVMNGTFDMPSRFFKYIQNPSCDESGCNATYSFENDGADTHPFCQSEHLKSTNEIQKRDDALVLTCPSYD